MAIVMDRLLRRRQSLYGVALLRVALSAVMLAYYLLHVRERAILWGPAGQLDWAAYTAGQTTIFDLYRYSASAAWAESLFWFSVAAAAANCIGRWPRISAVAFALTTYATLERNAFAMDGGQELLVVLAFYLCFTDCGRHFAWRARTVKPVPEWLDTTATAVHNVAVFSIAAQICILYFWTGFYKISGPMWRDGSALYYILRDDRFTLPGVSQLVYGSPLLVTIGTYATVVFQLSFPYLMWVRRAKPFVIALALGFHTGIAVLMGLVMFSAIMVIADFSLLTDGQFETALRFARSVPSRLRSLVPSARRTTISGRAASMAANDPASRSAGPA